MERPLRVLVIHNYYQQHGGEAVAVQQQLSLLQKRGHEVTLFSADSTEIRRYSLMQRLAFFPRTFFSPGTYRRLQTLICQERPDVAHVHNVFPLLSPSVYLALKRSGVPAVQTVHNYRFLCPNGLFYVHGRTCERCKYGNLLHAIWARCYRDSFLLSGLYALTIGLHRRLGTLDAIDRYIALTEFAAQKLVQSRLVRPGRVSILGNFLPDPLPSLASSGSRGKYLVYLGRLSAEKGIWTFLEAMVGLPDVHLKVLGDGPLAAPVRDFIRRHGLRNVEMAGFVAGEEKWEILRRALATVVPSLVYENFPLSALESLAVATPVIASDSGSLPYVVNDSQSGLLFKSGDSGELREKMAWLTTHPDRSEAMGQYGRSVVEQKYREEVHYKELTRIYDEVLAEKCEGRQTNAVSALRGSRL
ncbi:MAG: glycosyltransferase family 4 protein [Chloroflexi bacterium]|nr:glycosyltransferase family 4 protein [Chloroflexota bacterium]